MSAYEIRNYSLSDIPAMKAVWKESFGDSDEFLDGFFALLPDNGTAVLASSDEGVLGVAYVLTCQALKGKGIIEPVVGYIYAVAVKSSHRCRGLGSALTEAAIKAAKRREAKIITTLPASPELYSFYERFGLRTALRRKKYSVPACDIERRMKLTATEYMMYRRFLLPQKPYLYTSESGTQLEKLLCECYGGGLYATDSGIAAGYFHSDICRIHEIICRDEGRLPDIAASLAFELGASAAEYWLLSPEGEPFIVADSPLPEDCIWSFCFD